MEPPICISDSNFLRHLGIMCQSARLDIDIGNAWDLIREMSPLNLDGDTSFIKHFLPKFLHLYSFQSRKTRFTHTHARAHARTRDARKYYTFYIFSLLQSYWGLDHRFLSLTESHTHTCTHTHTHTHTHTPNH